MITINTRDGDAIHPLTTAVEFYASRAPGRIIRISETIDHAIIEVFSAVAMDSVNSNGFEPVPLERYIVQ